MEHQIEIYTSPDGSTQIEVQFEGDTFWLNLNQISNLFEKDKSVISRHLKNIFTSGELIRDSVVAKNATTAQDGKTYNVEYYNLDAILSVGYRVNSKRGTQFRQWATKRLKDYLLEGWCSMKNAWQTGWTLLFRVAKPFILLLNCLKVSDPSYLRSKGIPILS
jgi:hypothetical protein